MDALRWQLVEEIFHRATATATREEREDYLAQVCSDDPSLRDEVNSLIKIHDGDSSFLESAAFSLGLSVLANDGAGLLVGQSIARYEIISLLGSGGMGSVYLAHDSQLGRKVALKVLTPSVTGDQEQRRRFTREARMASQISHPNVASIHEVGEFDGRQFIAMELIDGVTLRERLSHGALALKEALDIMIQIARAIGAAHAVGIIHRDIKPENIMIRSDGYVKVLDFGLAKLTAAYKSISYIKTNAGDAFTQPHGLTEPGMLMGTVTYMSPEQVRGFYLDGRSDLWSLGVLFYELLTRRSPFLSDTPSDTIAAILKSDPPSLAEVADHVPPDFDRVVVKLLSKSREARYQNISDLLDDLNALQQRVENSEFSNMRGVGSDAGSNSISTAEYLNKSTRITANEFVSAAGHIVWPITPTKIVAASLLVAAVVATALMLRNSNPAAPIATRPAITSVAVLPLVNSSSDTEFQYISEGLSETLIAHLSRMAHLRVIARSSSFRYAKKPFDTNPPSQIARELGVEGLVTGTFKREHDDLRVTLTILDKTGNLPALLRDISRDVAQQLNSGLTIDELQAVAHDEAATADAYDLYLKGRFYWNQLTEESLRKSIDYFNQALEIKPNYALAHSGLAIAHAALGGNYGSPATDFPEAELHANKALELDSQLPEAHYAKAATDQIYRWDMAAAEKELQECLRLNSNYAMAYGLLAGVALTRGDLNEASKQVRRALQLDPLNLRFNMLKAYVYYFGRQNELALEEVQRILNQESSASFLYNDLARIYAQMGKFDEALAASQKATILTGRGQETLSTVGIVYALSGKTKEAQWVAETLEKQSKERYVEAYFIAAIYAALGDKERAFAWLGKAHEEKAPHLLRFKLDPVFDKIRGDGRYNQFIEGLNFG
jgi:eukaryotic-like serine/threonine-protein kinase